MLAQHPRSSSARRSRATSCRRCAFAISGGLPETPKDLDEYKAWFAGAAPEQIVGDVSPPYLWSKHAAEMIAEVAARRRA